MAEECAESSSAPPSNWWDLHGQAGLGLSSWCNNNNINSNNNNNNNIPWQHLGIMPNPNSNNSDEDASISTSFTSNHSGLTVESSSRLIDPPERTGSDQIWSQVFSNVGSNEGDNNNLHQDVGENFLDMLSSSKNMFESNYLKKLDGSSSNNWDHQFSNPNFNNSNNLQNNAETTKLSNLISTWSIALPESAENFSHSLISLKSPTNSHGQRRGFLMNNNNMVGDNNNSYEIINNPVIDSYISGEGSVKNNFADVISFSGRLGKSFTGIIHEDSIINNNKSCGATKSSSLSDYSKKQGHLSSSSSPPITKSTGRSENNTSSNEGKKKRNDEDTSNNSETNLKKQKNEGSTASSTKVQAPKVKLGEKITALQQIVSPFGKTDTASVLYEAIQYIKFLEEQIQLFSNPYMKTRPHKGHWRSFERKVDHAIKADHNSHSHNHNHNHHHHNQHRMKVDLKSLGLCLVPVLCMPQVYRENTGSDFWTPTYRGCMYR